MTSIIILDNGYTNITRHADPDERWDGDDTSTDHNIYGFKVVADKHYHDLMVGFECEYDRAYSLLYVLYSSGDSFSSSEGNIEHVGLFEDAKSAIKNKRIIEDQYRNSPDKYEYKLFADTGAKYQMHAPWCGYFESLESVEIIDLVRIEN